MRIPLVRSGCALVLLLLLFSGCVTGGGDQEPPVARGWTEEVPGGLSPFSQRNIVRASGVSIAFPAGWRVARVGDGTIYGEDEDAGFLVSLTIGADGTEPALEQYAEVEPKRLLLGGEYVDLVYFPGAEEEIPRLAYWKEEEPRLLLEFRGSPDAVAAERQEVEAILSSVRRDPYKDSGRFLEGAYVFHGHGSGWEFVRDISGGAIFAWFDQPPSGRHGWTTQPKLLLILRRGAPVGALAEVDGETTSANQEAPEYVATITEAGPLLYKPYHHRVAVTAAGALLTADPVSPEPGDWHVGVLAGAGNEEFMLEEGAVWDDRRVKTFFAGCFAAAP